MKLIEANCPACGPVRCAPTEFELHVCTHSPASYYVFGCPQCGELVRKAATLAAVELLIAEGVQAQMWHLPAEILEVKPGPPLTADDLLDFLIELDRDDWVAELPR